MGSNHHQSTITTNRAIINGVYDNMIIPNKHNEVNRTVKLEEGSHVKGGIYARRIDVSSNTTVEGPVFAREGIDFQNAKFQSEVASSGPIIGQNSSFSSGITADIINIKNCIIRTNVTARQAIIKDSIILGLVTGSEKLEMDNTLCHTFKSGKSDINQVSLLLPHAIIHGKLHLHSPIKCPFIESEKGSIILTKRDIVNRDGVNYLTISPRVMNLKKVKNNIIRSEKMQEFLYEEVLSELIMSEEKSEFTKGRILERLKEIIQDLQFD